MFTLYWDGTPIITGYDDSNPIGTRVGLRWYNDSTPSLRFSDFAVNGTAPPSVDHIVISPAPASLNFEATTVLTAMAFTASNEPLPDAIITWTSSDQTVAEVTPLTSRTARVRGLFVGTVTVAATPILGNTAVTTVTVQPGRYIFHDSFSESGVPLDSHLAEINAGVAPWVTTGVPPMVQNGHAVFAAGQSGLALLETGRSDGAIAVNYYNAGYGGLVVRATDANNYLFVAVMNTYVIYYRVINGQLYPIAGAPIAGVDGQARRLEVRMVGPTIEVRYERQHLFFVNDTFNVTATKHGMRGMNEVGTSEFDNFQVFPIPQPASIVITPGFSNILLFTNQRLTAQAFDASGALMPEASFTWSTSDAETLPITAWTDVSTTVMGMTRGENFVTAKVFGGTTTGTGAVWVQAVSPSCVVALPDPGFSWAGPGGDGQFSIIAENKCQWTVTSSDPSWLVPITTNGVGSIGGYYFVKPNGSPWERSAYLSISGHGNIPITQGPAVASTNGCFNGFFPGSITVSAQGGQRGVDASAPFDCVWTTRSTASWLHAWTASGMGSAELIYIVEPNEGPERSAAIIVNGQIFVVTQQAGPSGVGGGGGGNGGGSPPPATDCVFDLRVISTVDTTLRLLIVTDSACQWAVTSDYPVAITPASGAGPGEITVEIAPNLLDEADEYLDLRIADYTVRLLHKSPTLSPSAIRIPIPLPCIDSLLPWCNIEITIILPLPDGGGQSRPPEFLCPDDIERGVPIERGLSIVCGLKKDTGDDATISNWQFTTDDGRTITRGSSGADAGSGRIWGGTMVIGGTLSVQVVWRRQPYPFSRQIKVRGRDWRSRFPAPERLNSGYIPQLEVDDPPHFGAPIARYWATHDGFGDVVAIGSGPNSGYSYVRRKPSLLYLWAGSDAMFVPLSANYGAFEAAHCGSYSMTNPFGFATAQQARNNVTDHETGVQNSHYASYSAALDQSRLNLGLIAEAGVDFGSPAALIARVGPEIADAWEEIRLLGKVEPCNAPETGDEFVRGPACEPVGRWNLFSPFRACP